MCLNSVQRSRRIDFRKLLSVFGGGPLTLAVIPVLELTDDTNMTTTLKETLAQLEALGNEKVRAQNSKNGAGDNQFGVRLGDIRKLVTKIKTNHALAIALWETGNIDARLLAILLINPKN
ncbi:MAG: DNA alkylation repair protein, partial [Acidobacteria bacterium]|nr:DNA alkylation repair protein [Acidobacteriota bacterium]